MNLLNEFVNSVLIVDDKKEEIEELEKALTAQDVYVSYLHPTEINSGEKKRSKNLLFLDFMLEEGEYEIKNILSKYIRPLLENCFNNNYPYGIVIWSQHDEEEIIQTFYEKLNTDLREQRYTPPLFVVTLEKKEYLTNPEKFSSILEDLNKKLESSISATFSINWYLGVFETSNTTITNLYNMSTDYSSRDIDIKRILFMLAKNYSGIPENMLLDDDGLSIDAYKALSEILTSDLSNFNKYSDKNHPLFEKEYKPNNTKNFFENQKEVALLNTNKFLDFSNQPRDDKIVEPGNIYLIPETNVLLSWEQDDKIPEGAKRIAIELTPPCDFSNKKVNSRLVGGIYFENKNEKAEFNKQKNNLKADYRYPLNCAFYKDDKIYSIYFDFRYLYNCKYEEINKENGFQLFCKAKQPLFADILQKFSSHAARLGISNFDVK